jgi:TolA-binding protein
MMRLQPDESAAVEEERRPVERELADLRREVVEARNLVIKTDNLLKNLHAELKAVAKKGDDQYKRAWYASAVAYGGFLVLAVALSLLASRATVSGERGRLEAAQADAEQSKKRADELAAQAQKQKQDADQARLSTERALTAYRLMTEGEGEARLKGVDELAKLDRSRLTALEQRVLDDRARVLKTELGMAAFDRGRTAVRRDDMRSAAAELRRYLALDPEGSESLQANYLLGAALYTLKDYEGAVAPLERFAAHSKGQKNADYALFLLGSAHGALGHQERAAEIFKKALADFPGSEYAPSMQVGFRNATRGAAPAQMAPPSAAPAEPRAPAAPIAPADRPPAAAPIPVPSAPAGDPRRP